MLVLTRRIGEKLILRIDGLIVAEVQIVSLDSGKIRVGVQADQEVEINRLEIDLEKYPRAAA